MEFVSAHDIPNADLVAAGAGGKVGINIQIPPAARLWSLVLTPRHTGGPVDDPDFIVSYHIGGGEFDETNPPTEGTALRNKANLVTREDPIGRVRLEVTNGATIISGDFKVRLFIDRG